VFIKHLLKLFHIVIPPRKGEKAHIKNHWMKNRNILEIEELGKQE
jgi:hypothetical protein